MIGLIKRKIRRRPFPTNIHALRTCRISYSQFGEDLYLTSLLGYEKTNGTYVDVGCFRPIDLSNTYIFYQRGWKGLAFDPNPEFGTAWRQFRPRDAFFNYAISKERKRMAYLVNRKYPAMNTVVDESEIASFDPAEYRVSSCEALPLAELLNKHLQGNRIDLMSIDCEGMDLEVLQTNDFDRYRPGVIAVEDVNLSPESKINQFLAKWNYEYRAYIGLTKVFQSREQ